MRDALYIQSPINLTKLINLVARARSFKAGLRYPRVSERYEFGYESLKGTFSLILFVHSLITVRSKKNKENYPRKCF